MNKLDRLLEIHWDNSRDIVDSNEEEFASLKSEIQALIEDGEKIKSGDYELFKKGEMETADNIIKELESQIKELREELRAVVNYKNQLEKDFQQLTNEKNELHGKL